MLVAQTAQNFCGAKCFDLSEQQYFVSKTASGNTKRQGMQEIWGTCRYVSRLDGARGKKQVWHPHVRT